MKYMVLAHERDQTFNEFCAEALQEMIKNYPSTGFPVGNDADFGASME